jgi:hypothetical protein
LRGVIQRAYEVVRVQCELVMPVEQAIVELKH